MKVNIPNGNLYELGGRAREFMARGVYRGGCMCAYEERMQNTQLFQRSC